MTEAIVSILVGIAIGIGLVMLYVAFRLKMITNALDEYIKEALDEVKDSFITILVEKDNGVYYCYQKENHQFLCQGNTVEEIKQAFKLKFPNKIAIVSNQTDKDIVEEFKRELNEEEKVV